MEFCDISYKYKKYKKTISIFLTVQCFFAKVGFLFFVFLLFWLTDKAQGFIAGKFESDRVKNNSNRNSAILPSKPVTCCSCTGVGHRVIRPRWEKPCRLL